MKKFLSKRVLSLLLALVMIVGMLPMSALTATAAEAYGEVLQIDTFKGRVIDSKFALMIPYYWDSYGELPRGTNVESWFTGLPEDLTPIITEYTSGKRIDGSYAQYVHVRLDGIPETTGTYTLSIAMPEIFGFADPVTYQATLTIKELAPCSGCTFKTINEMQVCYKEGKGIHVCETNFGDEWDTVGDKYDKSPEDGYISAEEEPSRMTDGSSFWYFFDIEEVDVDSNGTFQLYRFANLRTVNIESGGVVIFGENNTKLESIITDDADVKGLSKVPASAPLQKVVIKNATVDRYNYNFPMLEKLVLTDSVIDGEADDQIFITKDCAALKHIDLNGTDLSHNGSDTNISYDLANLEYLDVSKTGIQKVNIAHYLKLKYFYAANNGLTEIIGARGEGGKTLADKCPELVEVDISGNNVNQFDLGAHQNIRKLDLSNNKFTAFSAVNLPALKEFRINQQNEAGSYTSELAALYVTNCPQLEILDASYQMNSSFGVALENLPKLKELDLTQCFALTSIPADVAATVEILKISECTSLNEQFTAAKYPKLKELYAKNVTIESTDGTKGLFVSAPNVEVIEYKGTNAAEWIEFRGTNKLEFFVLQGSTKLKSVTVNGAESLEELWLGNNINLEELTLNGTYGLETLDIHVDDPLGTSKITSLELTDCYSLNKVGVSKGAENIKFLLPDHPGYPDVKVTGWRWVDCETDWHYYPYGIDHWDLNSKDKISDTLKDHEHNHYRSQYGGDCHDATNAVHNGLAGLYAGPWGFPIEEERYRTWNYAQWEGIGEGNSDSGDYLGYKATFNLSPYKETSIYRYGGYAVTAPTGVGVDMPGLVGWATKKFATESEIEYYAGEKIYLTGDIEFWPVYNTETIVYYSAGNYSEDIGWNMKAGEVDGLEESRSYEYKHTLYGKSSLYDYWTYNILDLVPTREGYIFRGWQYSTANGVNIYQPGDEIEVVGESGINLSAKWEKAVEMPSAYTYLSCDYDYFEKGDRITLTAKVVGLNGADVSETRFKAFLYLYEEGKESEKTKVAENIFTGDEVDLTFTYPADDTRIAYVEIFAYTGGDYSQKSITDDYKLVPASAIDVEFKYSIGDGYVTVTEDTTIVLPQGANDGWLDIEVDAIWGKGDLNIRLYEINSNVTVGTEVDNVVSTNTIGTKNYRASVSDETGNTVYTKQLTVKIVPELEVTDMSDDVEIANAQDVNFTIEYVGYNVTPTLTNSNGSAVSGLEIVNRPGNERNGYTGTVAFVIPVSAPAGDTATYTYDATLVDEFGNEYECEFHVYFDKTKGLTFAATGRGELKFYKFGKNGEYTNIFANETDIVAELDGGWIYDIMDIKYKTDRDARPDNVLIPTVGDGVEVLVKLFRYESYEAYKNGGSSVNVYEEELGGEYDSRGYRDISDLFDADDEYIPGNIDLLWDEVMTPGYYAMTLEVKNTSAVGYYDEGYCFDIYGSDTWNAYGYFEILADGQEHVHDYKLSYAYNGPECHVYKCYCGATYEEDHVFSTDYPIDGLWKSVRFSYYDENGSVAYADSNLEERWCTICLNSVYRWRFLESFTIDNADLQEGKTDAYEKTMAVDQTLSLVAKLDFLEEFDPRTSTNSFYTNTLSGIMADFYPVNTKINWTSSNQDVAKVDENGVVTTVGEGTALITGTTVQPNKETGEPMTVTILINVNCKHAAHKVKVPAQEPTCQADGHIEHYMCLDCTKYSLTGDFTDTVSYENDIKLAKVDHAKLYGVWHSDANGHWRECKYGCGTKFDEGTHYSTEAANCQHPEYCAVCDYVLAPITAHSHDKYGWSEGYHWSICECGLVVEGSNEVHQFGADGSSDTCDDCGYKKNVGYTVSGTITSYLKAEGDITVQLLSGEEVAYSQVFNTYTEVNASRKEYSTVYSIPAVVDGTYTLRISKDNHVTRDYSVTVSGGVMTQDAKIHLKGDITGDGQINIMDVNRANLHFKKKITLTDYEFACANVTGDTQVNIMDVNRMNLHFKGKSKLW